MKYVPLSNIQIEGYFNGRSEFGGVFSKDTLPNIIQNKSYIVNLGDSDTGGSHWCLIYNYNIDVCLYFDPFGIVPPKNVLRFMRTSKKHMYYSSLTHQDLNSILCGYYCIYVIDQMVHGRTFLDIVAQDFSNDRLTNERLIKKYFSRVQF